MDHGSAIIAALMLGMWTAAQPCPMATNVAAISYLGRRGDSPRWVLLAGLLYALGRTLVYVALAVLLVESLQISRVSIFLQTRVQQLVGPVLVVLGMFLLDLMPVYGYRPAVGEKTERRLDALGLWGALPLGAFFALAFCPVSAACFFGSLFAMAVSNDSRILLPSMYGIGTAVPVVAFALLIALAAQAVDKAFHILTQVVWWMQRVTGFVCVTIGIHLSLKYIFALSLF